MEVQYPITFDYLKLVSGEIVKCKRFNIGPWNMDALAQVTVVHDIAPLKVFRVDGVVWDDALTTSYPLLCYAGAAAVPQLFIYGVGININIVRVAAGYFDSALFDDAVMNRGHLYLWYVP